MRVNMGIPAVLRRASAVLIGPGSLFTSLVSNLILPGVGEPVLEGVARGVHTYVLLNSMSDRESGSLTAGGVVEAITSALCRYGQLTCRSIPDSPISNTQY
jgi:2-phospho-L-lactate transferase/gluconeogenesis factor (CofD/UPF0052 family)